MIRQATPDDIPALVTLGARMHAESRFAVLAYNPEKAGRTLAHVLETGFLWVATDDGRIVGGMAVLATGGLMASIASSESPSVQPQFGSMPIITLSPSAFSAAIC